MSSNIHDIEQGSEHKNDQIFDNKNIDHSIILTSIGQRLQIFINHLGMSNNKFGQGIGVSGSMVSHMINGNNFGIDKLVKILQTYPFLNVDWLLTGKGAMLKGDEKQNSTDSQKSNDQTYLLLEIENKYLKEQLKGKDNELKAQSALNTALQEIISMLKK